MKNGLAVIVIIWGNNVEKVGQFLIKTVDEMTGREVFCVERLRSEVFVSEQKITLPELDDIDLHAWQVFLLNEEKTDALSTCRIFQDQKLGWMLGRVAVNKTTRGQHLGSQMLQAVHKLLISRNVETLSCHAQISAKPFYDQLGYQVVGDVFDEGGVEHVMMTKKLG
ncbi:MULTISPECIES: GNAT family N-acetyltransferase [Lactobacillus]|uniref:GNAT family N-acetyltransferase n=1 Tax=Lactobacillus xujianguonis TaxID=2495899 RepID=A0A437SUW9_9LACO|nr:GNAT family N-acetyltransferase [Lactobacillus xujianguonis]RVU77145.1 GNAT family N-acetyltransferase [Lactobacillus xujianguonis]